MARRAEGDLAGDEVLAPPRRLVVEDDAVADEHAVGLAIVDRQPMGIDLGGRVGRTGIERRRFLLRHLPDLAEHLRRAGLIDPRIRPAFANAFQDPQRPQAVHVARVFRDLEADLHVALRGQVVDLVGPDFAQEAVDRGSVAQVAVVQHGLRERYASGPALGATMWSIRPRLKELERRVKPWTS